MRSDSIQKFRQDVWNYYRAHGRNELPWRKTTNPYKILVSEMMLQQTQVSRVIGKYKEFLRKFPTVRHLAKSDFPTVLKIWSGLGYNRRAKYLHDASRVIFDTYGGDMKKGLEHQLPGVGPYTLSAVRTFAFNEPHTMIETNIRTVFIHHFYRGLTSVADRELLPLIEKTAKNQDSRTWHWALMDYGAYLKKSGVRNNAQSKRYTKQSKFEGSIRQVRGAILRELQRRPSSFSVIHKKTPRGVLGVSAKKMEAALAGLERDGLIRKEKGKWRIA